MKTQSPFVPVCCVPRQIAVVVNWFSVISEKQKFVTTVCDEVEQGCTHVEDRDSTTIEHYNVEYAEHVTISPVHQEFGTCVKVFIVSLSKFLSVFFVEFTASVKALLCVL